MKDDRYRAVFAISLVLCAVVAVWALAFNEGFIAVSQGVYGFLTQNFAWLYLLAMFVFVVFCVAVACSRFGSIKLGPDDSKPEFRTLSWFAMLFACGKGVGLIFWGVAEPVSHYMAPAAGVAPQSAESAAFAFQAAFTHWGVQPWANYAIIGLALAYFQFRKGKPALVSSALSPLIGEERAAGWLGKVVDTLAVFATIAGIVTSLGLGVMQISGGVEYLFGISTGVLFQAAAIIVITVVVVLTAVSGLEKGIKAISDANLYLAIAMLAICFLLVPQVEVLNNFVGGLGGYIQNFAQNSFMISGYGDNSWTMDWRVFYWAWWIAWAPFVGLFIARISKGRTVREFIVGVVFIPALGDIIWFSVFGTMGISLGEHGILSEAVLNQIVASPETGLFVVLQQYPFGFILSIAFIVLLLGFFVASANSGTYVLSMMSSGGSLEPPNSKKILWGVVQASLAIGLLVAGGLKPLQTIAIAAAFPFIFVMFATMAATAKGFSNEITAKPAIEEPQAGSAIAEQLPETERE